MANLQDLINLVKADGGKFFVIDEKGDAKLVIMNVEDYQELSEGKLSAKMQQTAKEIEEINREIIKAQLQDPVMEQSADVVQAPGLPFRIDVPKPKIVAPQVIYSQTSQAAVSPHERVGRIDLREEVIDPSFDFEGPKADLDDF